MKRNFKFFLNLCFVVKIKIIKNNFIILNNEIFVLEIFI